jgi:hypothetical protein
MDPLIIGAGIKLLGGLFGNSAQKKREQAQRDFDADAPRRNIISQLEGVRQGAKEFGFNPLTVFDKGQPSGAGSSGSPPPLASVDLLTGALQDVTDVATGESARRSAANKLQMELGQIQLDQLRSGVVAVAPSAAASVGSGQLALGRRAATIVPPSGPEHQRRTW